MLPSRRLLHSCLLALCTASPILGLPSSSQAQGVEGKSAIGYGPTCFLAHDLEPRFTQTNFNHREVPKLTYVRSVRLPQQACVRTPWQASLQPWMLQAQNWIGQIAKFDWMGNAQEQLRSAPQFTYETETTSASSVRLELAYGQWMATPIASIRGSDMIRPKIDWTAIWDEWMKEDPQDTCLVDLDMDQDDLLTGLDCQAPDLDWDADNPLPVSRTIDDDSLELPARPMHWVSTPSNFSEDTATPSWMASPIRSFAEMLRGIANDLDIYADSCEQAPDIIWVNSCPEVDDWSVN